MSAHIFLYVDVNQAGMVQYLHAVALIAYRTLINSYLARRSDGGQTQEIEIG